MGSEISVLIYNENKNNVSFIFCLGQIMLKYLFIICIICLFIIQIILYYRSSYQSVNVFNFENSIPIFESNTWVFNQNVSHFSAKLILTKEHRLFVEAFTIFNYIKDNEKNIFYEKIKCIVMLDWALHIFNISESIILYKSSDASQIPDFWKVRCEIKPVDEFLSKITKIRVALTDIGEFGRLNKSESIQNKNLLLSFQSVNFYDERTTKKKSVAHCVHMVYDLNYVKIQRLRNWLNIQKRIGIDRIKLYFTRVKELVKFPLKQEFKDYIEIIDYKLDFNSICKFPLYLNRTSWNAKNRVTLEYLYENCLNFYKYFNSSKFTIFNAHETICTNDCLIDFKYKYEFTTNYDIDEIIFPRKLNTNDFSHFKNVTSCSRSLEQFNFTYSIYDYAMKLTKVHGSNIGVFHFENVAFLTPPKLVKFFEKSIFSLPLNTTFQKTITLEDHGHKTFLNISSRDIEIIKNLRDLNSLVKCFNRIILNGRKIQPIWNVPYALVMKRRAGKSLFNTNLTMTYNQHGIGNMMLDGKHFDISINEGYVGHFRQYLEVFFKNQVQPFSDFIFDIEFYQFLTYFETIKK